MQKPKTLALLTDYVVSNYQVGLLRAVEHATQQRGASLLTFVGRSLNAPAVGDAAQNRVYELLGPSTVDGVILVSGCISNYCGPAALAEFCARYAPLPVCSIGVPLEDIPSLVISNRQGMRAVVEHLIVAHGSRRIAFLGGPEASVEGTERHQGYLDALAAHGLEADDRLLTRGEFSVPTGLTATRELFARTVAFDAIVAANDYMALAALDVLEERGLNAPSDIAVAGFDDAPFARFALPSLTTVRQPLERLGRMAVDSVLQTMEGVTPPRRTVVDVDVVLRQSCGCGLAAPPRLSSLPPKNTRSGTIEALAHSRPQLLRALHTSVGVPPRSFGGWAERLLDSLRLELQGAAGRFMHELEAVLAEAQPHPDFVDEFVKVVGLLRSELYRYRPPWNVALQLEQIWHDAQLAVGNAATNAQGRTKIDLQVVLDNIRVGFERIATALTPSTLRHAFADTLPDVQIRRACIGLAGDTADVLVPFFDTHQAPETPAMDAAGESPTSRASYPASQLVPSGFLPPERHSHFVLPLSFERDWFGLLVMEYATNETVYALLRDQVSSALKGGALHRNALKQAALREQLERQQLQQEAMIAARIQTDVLPARTHIEGLDISAGMAPVVDVGGDYYDVLPTGDGGWIGVGDVSGHGLVAGLLMMMIQAMVAALVRKDPSASPREVITALNAAFYDNVHHRLRLDDYATLVLLRFERSGRLTFAGEHEDLIVYRARTGQCELVPLEGVWVGPLPDVRGRMTDHTCTLAAGDLLVVYSDGVVEAMNEQHQQYGVQRLCELVRSHGSEPVAAVREVIMRTVEQWQDQQRDDVTVLVARYQAAADVS